MSGDVLTGYRTYLLSKSTISNSVGGRVYLENLPQKPTYPAIVLFHVLSETQRHLKNASGLARSMIQADVHSWDRSEAVEIAEVVRLRTEHYTGAWGTETIRNAIVESGESPTVAPIDGSQRFRHVRSLDVVAWHTEALPTT